MLIEVGFERWWLEAEENWFKWILEDTAELGAELEAGAERCRPTREKFSPSIFITYIWNKYLKKWIQFVRIFNPKKYFFWFDFFLWPIFCDLKTKIKSYYCRNNCKCFSKDQYQLSVFCFKVCTICLNATAWDTEYSRETEKSKLEKLV